MNLKIPQRISASVAGQRPATSQVEQLTQQRLGSRSVTTLPIEGEVAQSAGEGLFPKEYDGVPYSSIIEAWLQSKGIFGGAAEGSRNNTFFQLALDLRYICDFKKDWMLQVMPEWGLSKQEREQAIGSAIGRIRGREVPEAMMRAIERVKNLDGLGELDENAISSELRNPLPKKLPYIFMLIAKRYPQNPHAMMLCSLPCLGTLCSGLRATYMDGWSQAEPIFFCVLTAPQASGKRIAKNLNDLLMAPIKRHDDEEREKLLAYAKAKELAKNEKKQPEKPEVHIRMIPAKTSNRVFLERAYYAEGRSLYSFAEELDTMTKSNKGGAWADKSDILRLSWDGGEIGQDYASDNSFNAVVEARWNLLLCGTWGAVTRFFSNVEDGMMTRFMFAQLEPHRGKKLKRGKKMDEKLEGQIREEVERLHLLGSKGDEVYVRIPRTEDALSKWEDLQIAIWEATGKKNDALDILRRRSMAMGFRAAMVAMATEGMRETQAVADFAVWVAQEVLDQQMALFGKELNEVSQQENQMQLQAESTMRSGLSMQIFAMLPDEFTLSEVDELRHARGRIGKSTGEVSRWMKQGLVTARQGEGKSKVYVKVISTKHKAQSTHVNFTQVSLS